MAQSYFPLRWESTGDHWWYASPIDWAAANGHYDLVRELLHLDSNMLIKLTSLRRIRRLETVWDDDARFLDAAKCRSFVARNLFHECDIKNQKNSLIQAGYGGWLLYTSASAGDLNFVKELLDRDPLLVFGEGEYGVTDILYAAARSKNSEVFRLLFDYSMPPRSSLNGGDLTEVPPESVSVFRYEMMNRALHAAARGGNLEIMKELIAECSNVLAFKDLQSSTILHAASGKGQVEIVKYLVASLDIVNSRDDHGNASLHVAAFRGHLPVLEVLITASPASTTWTNKSGNTFLHMAVAGFRTLGFKRLDKQMELMRRLISGELTNIQGIINIRNNIGRTALHMAIVGNVHFDLIQLLMTVKYINLNIRDVEGMTPLDILRQQQQSGSSERLIKQLISAGGVSNVKISMARSAIASNLKKQGVPNSPGTSFRISDAEIFLYTGKEVSVISTRPSSCSSTSKSELTCPSVFNENHKLSDKKQNPVNNAARHLNILFRWPSRKAKRMGTTPKKLRDDDSFDSIIKWCDREETPTPLRQQFSKGTTLLNKKRTLAVRTDSPRSSSKKKYAAGLMHGVMQSMPDLSPLSQSSSLLYSRSSLSSDKQKGICLENDNGGASCSNSSSNSAMLENAASKTVNTRLMNQYFCFGARGLKTDDSADERQHSTRTSKRSFLSVT